MDLTDLPQRYWHCKIQLIGEHIRAIANDLTFQELDQRIVQPWNAGRPFAVDGTVVRAASGVKAIQIAHTPEPLEHYVRQHGAKLAIGSDPGILAFWNGKDVTYELLFSGATQAAPEPDVALVTQVCRRLPQVSRILGSRSRANKPPFKVEDEYDVQDLLHATLRAYLKYSVQEDPLPKVAGAKAGRADISVEELGVLIEIKFVRGPQDQKRIFEEISQDLVLYAQWPHLKTLILLIYNSGDLRDPEALEKLAGPQEVGGRRFEVKIILA